MSEVYLHPMTRELCHAFFKKFENDADIFVDMTAYAKYQYDEKKVNDSVKGKGYGTQAEKLALQYAFEILGMQAVNADTLVKNMRSQHVLEKVGFQYVREEDGYRYYRCIKGGCMGKKGF